MNTPKCCGKNMKVSLVGPKFMELQCMKCADVVFVRKDEVEKPQMLDD
jgi:hypothetical protein